MQIELVISICVRRGQIGARLGSRTHGQCAGEGPIGKRVRKSVGISPSSSRGKDLRVAVVKDKILIRGQQRAFWLLPERDSSGGFSGWVWG